MLVKYVVVKIGGSQYKVKEGDEIEVDRLSANDGEIELEKVLLLIDDNQITIGQPTIEDIKIKAKILSQLKGDKIRVSRFKAKSRYRKVKGFRPSLTKIKIVGIVDAKAQKTVAKAPKAAKPRKKITVKASK